MRHLLFYITSFLLSFHLMAQGQTGPQIDPNFAAYLKSISPTLVDGQNRINPQEAQGIASLNVSALNISSLAGIEAFVNLQSLDASNNRISMIPPLFQLTKLETLMVQNNQIGFVQGLGNLPQLKVLNVANNKIGSLPPLDNLHNLEDLNCSNNNLKSLPSTYNNTQLKRLDISNNHLQIPPDFRGNPDIRNLNFSKNDFPQLPDLANLSNLQNVDMGSTPFTFQELILLIPKPNFDQGYTFPSERRMLVGKRIEVQEGGTVLLSTGIDKGVPGMAYTWFFNGSQTTSVVNDSLFISSIPLSKAGNYHCVITNLATTRYKIITDTFHVVVKPCLDIDGIIPTITGSNCDANGTLIIKNSKIPSQGLAYSLLGLTSNTKVTSETGIFKNLTEPKYQLTLKTSNGCQKVYPDEIAIPIKECVEAYMTPDNDGEMDSYFFAQTGLVKIYNHNGLLVKTLTAPAHWDGSAKSAAKVAPGYYVADVNGGEALVKITVSY